MNNIPILDKTIHEPSRLRILVYLASRTGVKVEFTTLKTTLGFSAGNLSIQLKILEEASLVKTEKTIEKKKTKTTVEITTQGRSGLNQYINNLELLLSTLIKEKNK
ncbi:MAG: transcriptional regulator [Sphaerochaetaceae bacterium]